MTDSNQIIAPSSKELSAFDAAARQVGRHFAERLKQVETDLIYDLIKCSGVNNQAIQSRQPNHQSTIRAMSIHGYPPQREQFCGACLFFRQGECRVTSPQIGPRGSEWPTVQVTDWCGEWAPKEAQA